MARQESRVLQQLSPQAPVHAPHAGCPPGLGAARSPASSPGHCGALVAPGEILQMQMVSDCMQPCVDAVNLAQR